MKRMICVLLIILICVVSAACGSGATPDSATPDSAQPETATTVMSTIPPEDTFASVGDYLEDPDVSKKIKEGTDDTDSTVSMDVYADGDTLVYEYMYKDHIADEQLATVKENLDSALDANVDTYQNVINELKMYVRIEAPKVKVVFLNDDESEITSKIFE